MLPVYMERCDYTGNLAGLYEVDIQPTLFGNRLWSAAWDAAARMAASGKAGFRPSRKPRLNRLTRWRESAGGAMAIPLWRVAGVPNDLQLLRRAVQ
jgi:hypothetical protein